MPTTMMISDVARDWIGRVMREIVRPKTTYLPSSIFVLEPPSSTEVSRRAPSHSGRSHLHGAQFNASHDLPFVRRRFASTRTYNA
jgi:hypothetical protein